jgi:ankyrin repeat protein
MSIFNACVRGDWETVKEMVTKDLSFVNVKDDDGWTPLHYASVHTDLAMVEFLVSKGADVKAKERLSENTPLHFACDQAHLALVEFLVSKGAVVNAKSRFGFTPLHLASSKGHLAMVEFLEKGADVHAKNLPTQSP